MTGHNYHQLVVFIILVVYVPEKILFFPSKVIESARLK